ncbi:MAG: hypothetical protein IJ180_10335 [Bacteroidales bacterium]|nr:hypothetical protein [Bacteroidales bacterium]
MEKIDVLKSCRYYKGEDENPYTEQNKKMLWFYERSFCNLDDTDGELEEYLEYVGRDFAQSDTVPVELKALLFNRYCKGCFSIEDAVEGFKKFYKKYYPY